ncbi:MAG: glycosyl hydrolase family 18 protein [Hyphomicrobiales bacterium]
MKDSICIITKNNHYKWLFLAILFFASSKITKAQGPDTDHPKRIIAYYASWSERPDKGNYTVDKIPWAKLTHINYAFAGVGEDYKIKILDEKVSIQNEYPNLDKSLPYKGQFNLLTKYKKQYPHVKTLISIGGWAASMGFYEMSDNAQRREIFANSCIDFIRKYNFDGIDIDFEYPTSAEGAVHPLDDMLFWQSRKNVIYDNYLELMKLLREKINQAKAQDGKNYILSIAASGSSWTLSGMKLSEYCQYLDYLNIMTYDLHGAWNGYVGPQAALYASKSDPETSMMDQPTLNVDWAVKYYSGYMNPKNINIGIPFYSRGWTQVSGGNNGLWGNAPYINHTFRYNYKGKEYTAPRKIGQGAGGIDGIWNDPAPEPDAGANPLWHIMNLLKNPGTVTYDYLQGTPYAGSHSGIDGYQRFFDNETKAPYVWNSKTKTFFTYEDKESLKEKLAYVADRGVGGVMFWELSGDYQYDAAKGYYVAGNEMTNEIYDYFKTAQLKEPVQRQMPTETFDFDYTFSGTYEHPNFSPQFVINNKSNQEVPAGWKVEFDLPKSARWESTWGTGTLEVIDQSHPFWTRYRITGTPWQSIPAGGSVTISGAIKLDFSRGALNVTLNGKKSPYEKSIFVEDDDINTGVESIKAEDANVLVYPNPCFNEVKIISNNKSKIDNVTITDSKGAKIISKDINATNASVNIEKIPSGIYFIKIDNDNQSTIKKLIKQ